MANFLPDINKFPSPIAMTKLFIYVKTIYFYEESVHIQCSIRIIRLPREILSAKENV